MKLLVDENIHGDIVRWFRSSGHDVLYAADEMAGLSDEEILLRAQVEGRILVTDDKDFGELVFHRARRSAGVILLRLFWPDVGRRVARLREVWPLTESHCAGSFTVVGETRVRVRPMGGRGRALDTEPEV